MLRPVAVGSLEQRDEEPEEEGEEELRDGGVPFYVNRGGLPVDEDTWERMWRHVARIHPNGEALGREIRGNAEHPKVRCSMRVALHLVVGKCGVYSVAMQPLVNPCHFITGSRIKCCMFCPFLRKSSCVHHLS